MKRDVFRRHLPSTRFAPRPSHLQHHQKGVVYIQLVLEHSYNPRTKYSISKRIAIGRLADPNDRTRMYANVVVNYNET